jgi:hypothetical protein
MGMSPRRREGPAAACTGCVSVIATVGRPCLSGRTDVLRRPALSRLSSTARARHQRAGPRPRALPRRRLALPTGRGPPRRRRSLRRGRAAAPARARHPGARPRPRALGSGVRPRELRRPARKPPRCASGLTRSNYVAEQSKVTARTQPLVRKSWLPRAKSAGVKIRMFQGVRASQNIRAEARPFREEFCEHLRRRVTDP